MKLLSLQDIEALNRLWSTCFDFDVSFIGPGDSGPEIYWLDHWRVIIWDDRADAKPIAECENKSLAKCIEMILDMLRVIDAR